MNKNKFILAALLLFNIASCKKFVDPGFPATQLSRVSAFSNDATATAALLALYGQLERGGQQVNLVSYTGLSSDEFALRSTYPLYLDLLNNNVQPTSNFTDLLWKGAYQEIYWANAVLEGLSQSVNLSDPVKKQLEGEARFIRAYCHFQLVNLFGEVPIVTVTDYRVNSVLSRASVADVYKFINDELAIAASLVASDYMSPKNTITGERTRVNGFAVSAFRAKVALFQKKWDDAERFANAVISQNATYSILPNLNEVFLKNSKEQIWQIQAVAPSGNTFIGSAMVLTGTPTNVYLDERILSIYDANDKRKISWIGVYNNSSQDFYFAYKYKVKSSTVVTEYTSMIRLAEIFLIRAEAKAMQGKYSEAENDLNQIRERAGIARVNGLTGDALRDSIYLERRRELFTENANRWFDLKRSNRVDSVLAPIKGGNWTSFDALYPIPYSEIQKNRNLSQNPGY